MKLVIGGGITGAATAAFASEKIALKNVQVTIWDKARGAGGRMSTSRSPKNPKCTADLGAQYISVTSDYGTKHKYVIILFSKILVQMNLCVKYLGETILFNEKLKILE